MSSVEGRDSRSPGILNGEGRFCGPTRHAELSEVARAALAGTQRAND